MINGKNTSDCKCKIPDCNNSQRIIRGYCMKHYNRWLRNGDPLILKRKNNNQIRYCTHCKQPKALNHANFTKDSGCVAGLRYSCRDCDKIYLYPKAKFALYGLTIDGYQQLFEQQGRACSICKRTDRKLQVDHNHSIQSKTDSRRGLLCSSCNNMIKCENVDYLLAGIHYLNKWNGKYQ